MKKFDPTKPVQTRDGREARIICLDKMGAYPTVALVTIISNKLENIFYYTNEGRWCHEESPHDLINIPEKKTGYIPIIKGGDVYAYYGKPFPSKEVMFKLVNKDKILKIIEVEWEE